MEKNSVRWIVERYYYALYIFCSDNRVVEQFRVILESI